MKTSLTIELFIDKRSNGILNSNGMLSNKNESDFYVNVPLTRSIMLVEDYVDVTTDPFRTSIQRQLINPYFIELGFFETVNSISGTTDSIAEKAANFNIVINK